MYEGFRVLWYVGGARPRLSNRETKIDGVYRDRQDPEVTVGLKLKAGKPELADVWISRRLARSRSR